MQVSKNFIIQEFVGPNMYKKWSDKAIWFVDSRIISLAQFIRDYFDMPMTINNWHIGGNLLSEVYATLHQSGAQYSQHRFGRAIDFNLSNLTTDEIQKEILKHQEVFMINGLTCIEADTPTWVHVDCRYTGLKKFSLYHLNSGLSS